MHRNVHLLISLNKFTESSRFRGYIAGNEYSKNVQRNIKIITLNYWLYTHETDLIRLTSRLIEASRLSWHETGRQESTWQNTQSTSQRSRKLLRSLENDGYTDSQLGNLFIS